MVSSCLPGTDGSEAPHVILTPSADAQDQETTDGIPHPSDRMDRGLLVLPPGAGSLPKTIRHYEATFKMLIKYLDAHNLPHDSRALTTERMQQFATWLRDTPIHPRRGRTLRTPVGVFGLLKDLRAFIRWLRDEGRLEREVKVPVHKLPDTLFPI